MSYAKSRAGIPASQRGPFADPNFTDLLEYVPTYKLLHTSAFYYGAGRHAVAYPPAGAVLFALLYATGHPVVCYLAIAAAALGMMWWMARNALMRHGMGAWVATLLPATVLLVSFPFESLIQTGNIELFVWISIALGTGCYFRRREERAAAWWGLAAAIKLYPVILFVLFLRRRGWRPVLVGAATFVAASVASLAFLGPTLRVAFQGSVRNALAYGSARTQQWTLHEFAANHSLMEWFKVVVRIANLHPANLSHLYLVCGAVLLVTVQLLRGRRLPLLNQVLVATVLMVLLPPISYYYTLTNLYVPCFALALVGIEAYRRKVRVEGLRGTLMLFVPAFAAYTLFTFHKVLLFGGLIQSVVLMCILIGSLQYPFVIGSEEEIAPEWTRNGRGLC
jgi:hypothetical protein